MGVLGLSGVQCEPKTACALLLKDELESNSCRCINYCATSVTLSFSPPDLILPLHTYHLPFASRILSILCMSVFQCKSLQP